MFGNLSNHNPEKFNLEFLNRAVLTPKNISVTEINDIAMKKRKGDFHAPYKAIDTLELESQNCNYPKEWLQKLINGLPDWQLDLKLGAPVITDGAAESGSVQRRLQRDKGDYHGDGEARDPARGS